MAIKLELLSLTYLTSSTSLRAFLTGRNGERYAHGLRKLYQQHDVKELPSSLSTGFGNQNLWEETNSGIRSPSG
eukprot:1874231-Amphidinium_carterae.1